MRFLFGLIIGAVATVMLAPKLASLSPAAFAPIGDTLQAVASRMTDPRDEATYSTEDSAVATDVLPVPKLTASPAVTTTPSEVLQEELSAPILTELSQEQSVWVPFRSEVSARGFAGMLTDQLARQFHVLRAGPGQYLVVFGYENETERAEVLGEIRALTGYTQL